MLVITMAYTALVRRSDNGTGKALDLREEGIEPPTAGSGIQRSTTELFPRPELNKVALIQFFSFAIAYINSAT